MDPEMCNFMTVHFVIHCSTARAQAVSTIAHPAPNTIARVHPRMGSTIQAPLVPSTTAAPHIGALQAVKMENTTQAPALVSSSFKYFCGMRDQEDTQTQGL